MSLFFGLFAGEWLNLLILRNFTAQHVNNLAWLTVYRSLARDTAWLILFLITAIKE